MNARIERYELAWHPEHGTRFRTQLEGQETWSAWVPVAGADAPAVAAILASGAATQDPDTGSLSSGPVPDGGGTSSPVRSALDVPEEERTPNVGDDADEAPDEGTPGGVSAAAWEAEAVAAAAVARWRVAKSLLALRDQMNAKAPRRSKASDGTIGDAAHASRSSDHNPWVSDGGVGVVTALDLTHDPDGGCDADAVAEAIRASRDARVKYVIWNRRIANSAPKGGEPAWAWRPYTGANPHTKHVHISVHPEKARYDSAAPWAL